MPSLEDSKEWITVQDCLGILGFPSTAPNVRKKLELLSTGAPEMKRKKEGTKAYEYNIAILPNISKSYLGLNKSKERKEENGNEAHFWWEAIYKALTKQERDLIIDVFKSKGKTGVFPKDLLSIGELDIRSVSRSSIQTALVLEALPDAERREILSQYGIIEQGSPVAPTEEPHTKAI